jgi:hypothetical protein
MVSDRAFPIPGCRAGIDVSIGTEARKNFMLSRDVARRLGPLRASR